MKIKALSFIFIALSFISQASEIISVKSSPEGVVIPSHKKLFVAKKLRERADAIIALEEMVSKIIISYEKKRALLDKKSSKKYKESLLVETLREIHLKNQIHKLQREIIIFQLIEDITKHFIATKTLIVPLHLLTEILEEAELQLLLGTRKTFATESSCQIL